MSGPFGSSSFNHLTSSGFYNGVATQSLRFDDGSSPELTKTWGANETDSNHFTVSFWVKRCLVGSNIHTILQCDTAGGQSTQITFQADDTMYIGLAHSGTGQRRLITSQKFRDITSWYHILLAYDSENGTNALKARLYVNGEEITTFGTDERSSIGGDEVHGIMDNGATNTVGFRDHSGTSKNFLDGYLADFYCIDGQTLTPTDFIQIKNGVCIPKAYSGNYGNNGFRFEFKQTGTGGATSSTIGADTSGNGNHFTDANLSATDSNLPDSPENNFSTLNFLDKGSATTLSEGNLKSQQTADDVVTSTFHFDIGTKKHYAEFLCVSSPGTSTAVGVQQSKISSSISDVSGGNAGNYWYNANGQTRHTNSEGYLDYGNSFTAGDIIGIRIDEGSVYFYKNGTIQNSGTAAFSSLTGSHAMAIGEYSGTNIQFIANFGQDSSFAGQKTSGSANAKDAEDNGDFYYSVPSGHTALCTASLPEPTIGPNSDTTSTQNFNTVLYDGNGANSHAITGVGFQPDWLWIKRRDGTNSHVLMDSSRGSGSNDSLRVLLTNVDDLEYDLNDHVRSLDSDGFTLDDDTDNTVATNNSSQRYVVWSWKLNGGVTATNSNGSLTSTTQANTDAGVSIILYNGGGSAGDTIGHGLNSAPETVWFKRRGADGNWMNYVKDMGSNGYINLDRTNGKDTGGSPVNNTDPSSTVITLGSFQSLNSGGGDADDTYIAYAFHPVDGFSSMGVYTGDGSADGHFMFTGFSPAWILIKRTDASNYWLIVDDKRTAANASSSTEFAHSNPVVRGLYTNLGDQENVYGNGTGIDFCASGFKIRDNVASINASGGTYFFLAFARAPFKYANAR